MNARVLGKGGFMEKENFNKLWSATAKKEIEKVLVSCQSKSCCDSFKEGVYSRYLCESEKFKRVAGIKEDGHLDRHKVAALFYVAFVESANSNSFNVFGSKNEKLFEAADAVIHETAFNIACAILESIVLKDNDIGAGYRKYVEENGLIEPEMICYKSDNGEKAGYKEEILKQLVYAQRENKLSVSQLAITFFSLESNTYLCYELQSGD